MRFETRDQGRDDDRFYATDAAADRAERALLLDERDDYTPAVHTVVCAACRMMAVIPAAEPLPRGWRFTMNGGGLCVRCSEEF